MQYIYLILISLFLGQSTPANAAQLVSIRGVELEEESRERIWHFEFEMKYGRLLALCRVPDGWDIQSHNYGESGVYKNGGGHIEGDAEMGHDALALSDLNNLLLIDDTAPTGRHPVSFNGSLTIESAQDVREQKLTSKNFVLIPADRCP